MTLRHAIAVLAVTLTLATATPARAHHGYAGPVRLYLETVRLETQGQNWQIRAGVTDSGTGKPAPGFVVDASGAGPEGAAFGPVHLTDADADGRYDAALGPLAPGDWSVTVSVTDAPDSDERAVPVTRTWNLAVQPGQSLELVGRRNAPDLEAPPSSSGSSSRVIPTTAALIAAAAAVALTLSDQRRRRRRTPAVRAR